MAHLPDRRLHLCDLQVWGRDPDGVWWGLVTWRHGGGGRDMPTWHSAWIPGSWLTCDDTRADRSSVARLTLPADRAAWPSPWAPGWDTYHYGADYHGQDADRRTADGPGW